MIQSWDQGLSGELSVEKTQRSAPLPLPCWSYASTGVTFWVFSLLGRRKFANLNDAAVLGQRLTTVNVAKVRDIV